MDEEEYPGEDELVSRAPTPQDLANLCRHLNDSGTRYIVVGGFAIRGAGYGRETMDLDLVVATDPANEAKVYKALESLPDKAVLALDPGEIAKYTVIRVGDEICVDLMASASGIGYEEAAQDQIIRVVDSVLEKLLGARVGQLRSPVGKPALLDALFADFKDIARTSRAIAIEEPGFSSAAYRFPANYTEAATTHADSLLTLLEGDAVLIAKFIAFEMPADFVADLRADRDALDGSNSGKHSDNFEGVESTAAIETLLGEAQDLITRLDTVMHNKYSRNPDKLLAWKSASRVERAGRKTKPDGTTPTPSAV